MARRRGTHPGAYLAAAALVGVLWTPAGRAVLTGDDSVSKAAAGAAAVIHHHGSTSRYANGRIPASVLCKIGQGEHRLACDAAADWKRMAAAYRDHFGSPLLVTDSYRSYAGQVSCRARKGNLCAVPGTSNHGRGLAVDMNGDASRCGTRAHRWLEQNAGRYGWLWPGWAHPGTGSKPECWHWQYGTNS